ncbi:MAG: Lrp/AsnC ligand binding domain-containing protein [Bacteroidales bacterium]|jgi:Lrp/AsnC family transcriptional regulator for asnA, asnC and gidA|nr:Lrp/AsnC ligand binding domain-containing protein [Bacteroidales bacterium]
MPIQIDETDKKIINLLTENARIPFLEIARMCGISGAAIHQRVHKLEESGFFKGSRYIIDERSLGYATCAFVGIHLEKGNVYQEVLQEIKRIPEIVECHYTTGGYGLFVKIYAQDNHHLMNILNHTIQEIDGILSTETIISLEQPIERQVSIL